MLLYKSKAEISVWLNDTGISNTMLNLHNAPLHNNIQPKANDPCMQHGLANIRCSKIQLIINYPVAYYRWPKLYQLDGRLKSAEIIN